MSLGQVEMFGLTTPYPKAKRCYAWSYVENGENQYVAVLEIPQTAVKVAIASKATPSW